MMSDFDTTTQLVAQLASWAARTAANGIRQHTPEWHTARATTIGGSSLATLQGENRFKTAAGLFCEKTGLSRYEGGLAQRWGSLFEKILREFTARAWGCEIVGADLFVEGAEGVSYSPDGLGVISGPDGAAITLFEFKCPFKRLPSRTPLACYVSQVKMGLDVLDLPSRGMLVEGVFRRCSWDDLAPTCAFDGALDTKIPASARQPLALGFIGFCSDAAATRESAWWREYDAGYDRGTAENNYASNDLGTVPPPLFGALMAAVEAGEITVWYGRAVYDWSAPGSLEAAIDADLAAYVAHCAAGARVNVGVLPWKLFVVREHQIEKERNYLAPWMDTIREFNLAVASANAAPTFGDKAAAYQAYLHAQSGETFSDD